MLVYNYSQVLQPASSWGQLDPPDDNNRGAFIFHHYLPWLNALGSLAELLSSAVIACSPNVIKGRVINHCHPHETWIEVINITHRSRGDTRRKHRKLLSKKEDPVNLLAWQLGALLWFSAKRKKINPVRHLLVGETTHILSRWMRKNKKRKWTANFYKSFLIKLSQVKIYGQLASPSSPRLLTRYFLFLLHYHREDFPRHSTFRIFLLFDLCFYAGWTIQE